jgi:hypothetical protein
LFWCLLVLQIIWRIFFTPIWRIVQLDRLRTRLTPALIARDDPAAIAAPGCAHDWNRCCRLGRGEQRLARHRNDDVRILSDEILRKCRQLIELAFRIADVQGDGLAVLIAEIAERLPSQERTVRSIETSQSGFSLDPSLFVAPYDRSLLRRSATLEMGCAWHALPSQIAVPTRRAQANNSHIFNMIVHSQHLVHNHPSGAM